ncbi:MAG: anthranilate synthase component I family protein [Actinomycetota bacterium]|nr:anthranilate synthase component I family protein [Actinomycetota bacterium]
MPLAPTTASRLAPQPEPSDFLAPVLAALPPGIDLAVVRRGASWVVAMEPDEVVTARGADAFAALDGLDSGWWAGYASYDLGRAVERVRARRAPCGSLPDLVLARFDARLVVDRHDVRVEGTGRSSSLLTALTRRLDVPAVLPAPKLEPWSSDLSREAFEAGVRAVIRLIEAGECYQVNLTRRLTCPVNADPVALFAALTRHNPAPHAALIRLGDTAVVSASPERFLGRRGRRVETRPIKGTAAEAAVLAGSAKDRAENVMIVDLARNDLGRVCEFGSVAVPELCVVEPHPGLHHLVSTVTGTLRAGVGAGALLRATFPPASVTGAPKPRVLQAIEDLEASPRGIYCGAVGWIDADRAALDLNVAIRTFVMTPAGTELGVGAGIVADSDPAAEWRETELKVARLLAAAGRRR